MMHRIITSAFRVNQRLLMVFLTVCFSLSLFSQALKDSVLHYFSLVGSAPQEKLYLHLDKPFYGAGETIWFKGYLQNAITHKSDVASNYIIVELVNREDEVIQRKKIRREAMGFVGSISLPAGIPDGYYYLRGYSNWMLNAGPEFLYSRNIRIVNAIDLSLRASFEYEKQEAGYLGKITFTESGHTPFIGTSVKYMIKDGDRVIKKGNGKTNEKGAISISLPDPGKRRSGYMVEVTFDDPVYIFTRRFYMSRLSQDYDVTFFPEGGELLDGVLQTVAFKALGDDGLALEVHGRIYTEKGDTVASFQTEHDGMGVVSLLPSAADQYYADVIPIGGQQRKQIALPQVKEKGWGLSVSRVRQGVYYQIQKTEHTDWPEKLYLAVHTRGAIRLFQEITPDLVKGAIAYDLFDDGVSHFLLIDEEGFPLSERLFFAWTGHSAWQVKPDKEMYGKRQKVVVGIEATDQNGQPVTGDFSVSITDTGRVPADSLSDHILSDLLLTSDLKGHIENPGYYFSGDRKVKDRHLDFIMLTHGWRRFRMDKLTGIPKLNTKHFIEVSQSISGRIRGLMGKIAKAPITAFSLKGLIHQTTLTDGNGEFVIDDINFPENTRLYVQARTSKGGSRIDLEIDSIAFAPTYHKHPYSDKPFVVKTDYLEDSRKSYFAEGGEQIIHLKEINVVGKRQGQNSNSMYDGMSRTIFTEEQIEDLGVTDIYELLLRIPGVEIDDNTVMLRKEKPIIVVDDMVYEPGDNILESFHLTDIDQVNVLAGVEATNVFGAQGAAGAILIALKRGVDQRSRLKAKGAVWITPLGYSVYTEFYHPKYDTPEEQKKTKPDLRSTLYWNPSLTPDEEGKFILEYYTPDTFASQQVVIEGVGQDGTVYRTVKTFK